VPRLSDHARATIAAERHSFHMPGHKGGAGAPPEGLELFGAAVYELDLSELGGFDYLHGAADEVGRAQERAAALFGADRTWFLVNGATVGNLAALLGTVGEGDAVLMARGSHRSVYAGIALSGARPVYLPPQRNDAIDALVGIDVPSVAAILEHDRAIRAVHVTTPSYYGFAIPLAELASVTAAHDVALIVDEAHGSHFPFHPDFPTPALDLGADVVVHSPHKTLGSLTQSALLHVRHGRVDADRVDAALQMLQSSSPSSLLIVSLDVAIDDMTRHGEERWGHAIDHANRVRAAIGTGGPVEAYGPDLVGSPGIHDFDPIKVVIDVHGLGTTGQAAARWLRSAHGVNPEFSDLRRLVCSITPADTDETCDLLVTAVRDLRAAHAAGSLDDDGTGSVISRWPHETPEQACTPRRAQQAPTVDLPLDGAVGRVSAEMVVPYPPGIPVLVPGEVVDAGVIASIQQLVGAGSRLVGLADAKATTLRCLATD